MVMLTYFIFTYQIRSIQFIRLIIKIWLGLSVLAALYAFKQEFFGFFGFEERSNQIEGVPQLLFIANHWRKYSIFSDPVTFAYNMAAAGLLCAGLLTAPFKKVKKGLLLGVIVLVLTSMIFSGTRGAFPLVPAGLLLFAVLTFNKKTLMVIAITGVFTVGLILMPTSNQNILRFQSAFKPSNDASYQVREANQKKIKPFILSHPIGGGLGSTGEWGKRFSPNSYLSVFPPDSGYVRTTVELGFIGLIIFCILMFIILKTGIDNYYLIKNPELKSYCLAMVLMAFTWNIANFPQEALVQYPSNIIFSLTVALISVISKLDKQQTLLKENSTHTIAAK
jgi:O-antigen ligase